MYELQLTDDPAVNGPIMIDWTKDAIACASSIHQVADFAWIAGEPLIHFGALCPAAREAERAGTLQQRRRLDEAVMWAKEDFDGQLPTLCPDCTRLSNELMRLIVEASKAAAMRIDDKPSFVFCEADEKAQQTA